MKLPLKNESASGRLPAECGIRTFRGQESPEGRMSVAVLAAAEDRCYEDLEVSGSLSLEPSY